MSGLKKMLSAVRGEIRREDVLDGVIILALFTMVTTIWVLS